MTWTRITHALSRCLILGLAASAWPAASRGAPDRDSGVGTGGAGTGFELIAFEAPGCNYCPVFRRDVLPSYAATRAGKTAPLRFIDVNEPAVERLQLSSPVTMVPTLVILRDGMEIGRINGYFGRENMHRMLETLLPAE